MHLLQVELFIRHLQNDPGPHNVECNPLTQYTWVKLSATAWYWWLECTFGEPPDEAPCRISALTRISPVPRRYSSRGGRDGENRRLLGLLFRLWNAGRRDAHGKTPNYDFLLEWLHSPERRGIQRLLRLSGAAPRDPSVQRWCEKSTSSCATLASVSPAAQDGTWVH